MKLYCVINDHHISRDIWEGLENFSDEWKLIRIRKYKRREDYENALIADALARYALLEATGVRLQKKPFLYNEYGKPYVETSDTFRFNVSHSGRLIVCGTDKKDIGVDVQLMENIELPDIARRFFAPQEYHMLCNAEESARKALFYDLWTLKESYIKALGKGLSIKLDSFAFVEIGDSIRYETKLLHEPCFFKQYPVDDLYKLSVCSFTGHFATEVTPLKVEDIYETFRK